VGSIGRLLGPKQPCRCRCRCRCLLFFPGRVSRGGGRSKSCGSYERSTAGRSSDEPQQGRSEVIVTCSTYPCFVDGVVRTTNGRPGSGSGVGFLVQRGGGGGQGGRRALHICRPARRPSMRAAVAPAWGAGGQCVLVMASHGRRRCFGGGRVIPLAAYFDHRRARLCLDVVGVVGHGVLGWR
jgi:hypothetical protein